MHLCCCCCRRRCYCCCCCCGIDVLLASKVRLQFILWVVFLAGIWRVQLSRMFVLHFQTKNVGQLVRRRSRLPEIPLIVLFVGPQPLSCICSGLLYTLVSHCPRQLDFTQGKIKPFVPEDEILFSDWSNYEISLQVKPETPFFPLII